MIAFQLKLFLSSDVQSLSGQGGHMTILSKRWCNGAACFSPIISMGQLLNMMDDREEAMHHIMIIDGLLLKEMDYFIKNCQFTEDEKLIYLRSRVTYWLFHQLLKGTQNCLSWTGEVTGDALKICS